MLRGLLAVLGGLVTVAVLELGALINAINAFRPGEGGAERIIFVAAALFAAGLAVLYLPAFSGVQHAGHHLVDTLSPLPSVGDEGFAAACDKRDRLRSMLASTPAPLHFPLQPGSYRGGRGARSTPRT